MKINKRKKESLGDAPIAHYGIEPVIHNSQMSKEKLLLELLDEEQELDMQWQMLQGRINNMEYILYRLDPETKSIIEDKYIHGLSWDELSDKYLLSRSGLDWRIRKRLENLN